MVLVEIERHLSRVTAASLAFMSMRKALHGTRELTVFCESDLFLIEINLAEIGQK